MRVKIPVLSLALIVALAPDSASAGPCNLMRIAAIDMGFDDASNPYVPMTISGQTVNMLIDTGGIFSMLSEQSVAMLGLEKLPVFDSQVKMFGGYRVTEYVEAKDVSLGGLKADRIPLQVVPKESLATGIGGMIAPNVLMHYDVDFDFGGGKFNLFSPDHCAGQVVYWTQVPYATIPIAVDPVGHIKIPVTLDGVELQAVVDTGATYSTMQLGLARALFPIGDKDLKSLTTRAGKVYQYHFKQLSFGGISLTDPEILLAPEDIAKVPASEKLFLIGMSTLRKLHLYIAYRERTIYATDASAR